MVTVKDLLQHYDAFGWVPTIRGALSLDLFNDSSHRFGDVDAYSAAFKYIRGFQSTHYLAATSYESTHDRKHSKKFARGFRTFFYGSINNDESLLEFSSKTGIKTDSSNPAKTFGDIMLGEVIIVNELTKIIPDCEIGAIEAISSLRNDLSRHKTNSTIFAQPFDSLDTSREEMLGDWEKFRRHVSDIKGKSDLPVYTFDILLTRDGILLIKDTTGPKWIDHFAKPGSSNDYHEHIPLPRIFKHVMNYVKFLFHSNYHHKRQHDTYLPVSNLCPLRSRPDGFPGIFRHQIDRFLDPVIHLKRKGFKDYSIEPNGIIEYARSFIHVCHNNSLIDQTTATKELAFLGICQSEIDHITKENKSVLNTVITQSNPIFIWSGVIAVCAAIIKISLPLYNIKALNAQPTDAELTHTYSYIAGVLLLVSLIFLCFKLCQQRTLSRRFKMDNKPGRIERFMLADSNLKEKRLSHRYTLLILWRTLSMSFKEKAKQITRFILLILIILLLIYSLYRVICPT